MSKTIKRTVEEVLDCETGETVYAVEFFEKSEAEIQYYRYQLEEAIQNIREPLFECFYCKQKLKIRGTGKAAIPGERKINTLHFAHLKDSDQCKIKTQNKYTKEERDAIKYNGAKESSLHIFLKEELAKYLRENEKNVGDITFVQVEKVVKGMVSKEWKKPDINALYKNFHIALELQLSTTWLSEIVKRQDFYKRQGYFMFWVFNKFEKDYDTRQLAYSDVFYSNNQNAYVFDEEARDRSKQEKDLVLKCYYNTYTLGQRKYDTDDEVPIYEDWECNFIKLSDLTFDEKSKSVYFFDANNQKREVQRQKGLAEISIQQERVEQRRAKEQRERERQSKEQEREEKQGKWETLNQKHTRLLEQKMVTLQKNKLLLDKLKKQKNITKGNIEQQADECVAGFSGNTYYQPSWMADNYDFFIAMRQRHSSELKEITKIIEDLQHNNSDLEAKIVNITKVPVIIIDKVKYRILDKENRRHWEYISSNWKSLKVFPKSKINSTDFFLGDYLKDIRSELEMLQLKHKPEAIVLTTVIPVTDEHENRIANNNILIEEQKSLKNEKQRLILAEIQDYFKEKINELNIELTKTDKELANTFASIFQCEAEMKALATEYRQQYNKYISE